MALCRPLVEAACRGLYVAYGADDRRLESVAKGAEPYPPFRQLIAMLDARLSVGNLFAQYSEVWKSLNDFTHAVACFKLATRIDEYGNVGNLITPTRPDGFYSGVLHQHSLRIAMAFMLAISKVREGEETLLAISLCYPLYGPTPATGYLH